MVSLIFKNYIFNFDKFALSDELDKLAMDSSKWKEFNEKWFCKTNSCKIPGLLKIGNKTYF